MRYRALALAGAANWLFAAPAWAAATLAYAPPAAWVQEAALPAPAKAADGAVQILLMDNQVRFTPEGEQLYTELAARAETSEALAGLGTIGQAWDPATDAVTIHHWRIIRDGRSIDLLANGKRPTILRRETGLEAQAIDGQLTATLQVEDLRLGDVLDISATVDRRVPLLKGHAEALAAPRHLGRAGRVRLRMLWPQADPVRWKASADLGTPKVSRAGAETELLVDRRDVVDPSPPVGAPGRYNWFDVLQLSDFKDWDELAALYAPLFAQAAKVTPGSPLDAEVGRIAAATSDPGERTLRALRLVQDQVRYFLVALDLGGYIPQPAEQTWGHRFGDCKAKTALLLAMLRRLGVEAVPALASSTAGDGLETRLPMLAMFDHVLVKATIGGRTYWLDGTRTGDRRLSELSPPDVRWVLPLVPGGARLEPVEPLAPPLPLFEKKVRFDLTAGLRAPARVQAIWTYRGDTAVSLNLAYQAAGKAMADSTTQKTWTDQYAWIAVDKAGWSFDDAQRTFTLTLEGHGQPPWSNDPHPDWWLDDTSLGWERSYQRPPGQDQSAPFAVGYPSWSRAAVEVDLPASGPQAALLNDGDLDETLAATAFHRTVLRDGGIVRIEASSRTLAREFPAAEGRAAEPKLRDMSVHDVALRIEADPPAAQAGPDPLLTTQPTSAADFARRGATWLAKDEPAKAAADFEAAVKLEPGSAAYLYDLGAARAKLGQTDAALTLFQRVLKLRPGDPLALTGRAQLSLGKGDRAGAAQDFEHAVRAAPGDGKLLRRIGRIYARKLLFADAAAYAERALPLQPADEDKAETLAELCGAEAFQADRLQRAVGHCRTALSLAPRLGVAHEALGLAELRLGQLDVADRDYESAFADSDRGASAYYGRGLLRSRQGRTTEAEREFAAALAQDPRVAAPFEAAGLKR